MNLTAYKKYFIGFGVVVATWLIFFIPILSGQYVYFLDDLKIIYYPIESVYAQFQHSWHLPTWSNAFGFGQPLIAWGQLGFFTPIHLLLRALYVNPLTLLQISVVTYFLLGSIGMFIFLIRRNLHASAASLGAILFAYCGFSIGHLNHVNFYTSTMLLPLLLLAIDGLIQKPSLKRGATLSLVAAAIAVSGQPQVISYVYAIATIIGLALFIEKLLHTKKDVIKILSLTIYAGVIALMLSSFAILPLQEFLPETERAAGLPYEELFEFSYPPYASVTLILPYFFGDHAQYSGPKGFQEIAAYTGIIPLLLAGIALTNWKKYKAERIAGISLALIGGALALGKYSFIYRYLVDQHYITTIGVVGRFVFFFDIGIVLLSAIGLQDILFSKTKKSSSNILKIIFAYSIFALLAIVPFWIFSANNPELQARLWALLSFKYISVWLILAGILSIPITMHTKLKWLIPILSAITLIVYGWNYNPRVSATSAYTSSAFLKNLEEYKTSTGLPARLYAAEHLPVTGNPHLQVSLSDYISPKFTVFQPLQISRQNLSCITVSIQADSNDLTHMDIMVRSGFDGTIWHRDSFSSEDAFKNTKEKICFPQIPESDKENLMLSFSSDETTNMKLFVTPSKNTGANVYFVRVPNPSPKQLAASLKPLSVEYSPEYPLVSDMESALMMRHIQALAGSSSARWIGALSIRPYREFVDSFFANDSDAFDGDGVHALTRNKNLVNLLGITHFAQSLDYGQTNDPMIIAGYPNIAEKDIGDSLTRLYTNPNAYPKAFVVPNAQFISADDEIRTQLRNPQFDPRRLAYLSGPTPPNIPHEQDSRPLQSSADIQLYSDTRVDVRVSTNKTAYLIVTDSTLPQWHTYIDDKPALWLKADTIFKAAQVPEGTHIVSFRYSSKATNRAKTLSIAGIIITLCSYAYTPFSRRKKT